MKNALQSWYKMKKTAFLRRFLNKYPVPSSPRSSPFYHVRLLLCLQPLRMELLVR